MFVVFFINEKYYELRKKQTDFFVRASSSIIIVYAVAVKCYSAKSYIA